MVYSLRDKNGNIKDEVFEKAIDVKACFDEHGKLIFSFKLPDGGMTYLEKSNDSNAIKKFKNGCILVKSVKEMDLI